MQTVRQRRRVQKSGASASTECPPTAVKSAGFKFWGLCTARNFILVFMILMILIFYRLKVQQPSGSSTSQEIHKKETSSILDMISKRNVLPETPILNAYYHRTIQTSSKTAQQYFDQAMVLSAAFNHDEAIRSLKYALMHDETCVMCHWGIAYNYGMNINRVNDEKRLSISVKHANLAKKYSIIVQQDDIAQDLVDAIILRFPTGRSIEDDVSSFLFAYRDAMQRLAETYPNDADVLTLYAESLMNTMPWNYYQRNENEEGLMEYIPKSDTLKVYDTLEKALHLNPDSLLALHLYIHIYEPDMKRVIANKNVEIAADRLRGLLASNVDKIALYGIGHLVHMPSHIYIRIGRFEDANIANIEAHTVAEQYYDYYNITDIHPNYNQFYRLVYYCHRLTFVIYSSMMNGQYEQSYNYGKYLLDKCRFSTENIPFFFENASWRDKTLIRFGRFAQLIENYEKDDEWKNTYVVGGDNIYAPTQSAYARAFGYVSLGQCEKGWDIYENEFLSGYNNEDIRSIMFLWQDAAGLLQVARSSFLGRYYDKCEDDMDKSVEHWTDAAKSYDKLAYMEPPFWPINNRACLGQVYLDRGEYENAIKVFKDDLDEIMLNGWGLKGIILALEHIDPNGDEVKQYRDRFREAWKYADTEIDRACY